MCACLRICTHSLSLITSKMQACNTVCLNLCGHRSHFTVSVLWFTIQNSTQFTFYLLMWKKKKRCSDKIYGISSYSKKKGCTWHILFSQHALWETRSHFEILQSTYMCKQWFQTPQLLQLRGSPVIYLKKIMFGFIYFCRNHPLKVKAIIKGVCELMPSS